MASSARSSARPVRFFGVVSAQTEKAVELFVRREDGGAMIRAVAEDEPELANVLRVEPIELDA